MDFTPRRLAPAIAAACLAFAGAAQAQISGDVVRIGFITDLSGVYSDMDGNGGTEAIRMAIADFGGKVAGKPVELVTADHQNKPDLTSTKVREWIDQQGVDAVIGGVNSAAILAAARITADKKKPFLVNAAVSPRLTNEECTPYTVHYAHDSVALAKVAGNALLDTGLKRWYFLTVDNAGGIPMEEDASKILVEKGGTKVGAARHPLGASDFSSFMLSAQAAKPDVLVLANSGNDVVNSIKAAREFGLTKSMKVAAMLIYFNEVQSLGLDVAQGLYVTESWYWDLNDETRAWAKRFKDKTGRYPTAVQAADYSSALTYLKAADAAQSDDGDKVMAKLKSLKIDDMYAKGGVIRPDGRMVHDMFLMQVKTPAESKYAGDNYKLLRTVAGDDAFTKKSESKCALWK